jgi:hypothetical protein
MVFGGIRNNSCFRNIWVENKGRRFCHGSSGGYLKKDGEDPAISTKFDAVTNQKIS